MLTPKFIANIPDKLSMLINIAENWLIQEIARKIKSMDEISGSTDYQLMQLMLIRTFDRDFKKELSRLSGKALQEIDEIYRRAAEASHTYNKMLYVAKGMEFVPFSDNIWLQQFTEAAAAQTKGTFNNLTQTVGFTTAKGEFLKPREYFAHSLTAIELQASLGLTSYDEAIKRTVKELSASGLKTVEYPYAKPRRVETSVRANVLTGISRLSGEIAWKNIAELGLDVVEITAHREARPSHVPWQGRRFSLNMSVAAIQDKVYAIREENAGVQAMRKAELEKRSD